MGWRWAVPIAVSGLALFAVFALISYLVPAAGVSDIGTFAGNLLHGEGGGVLERKVSSNVGTLTVSVVRWLIPVAAVAAVCRAVAAVVAAAAYAAAGVRGRAGTANRRLAVLAGACHRLACR